MEEELSEGNNTGLDHLEKRDSLYIVIPITILYSVIFLTGFIGNVITCIVIARNKHMHTATNYYLFSLAVSDLLLLVTGLPQEMYSIWSRYPYIFGEAFCILRGLAAETSANATVLTIAAFTVERYLAICHPFLAHTMSKLSRAVKFILTIWIIALAFAIPQAAQFGVVESPDAEHTACHVKRKIFDYSFEVSTFLFFFIPMTLITILYVLIGLRLRRSALLKKSSGSFGNHQEATRKGSCRQQSSSRVLKMLVAVVVAFFICWAPFHAQRLIAIYVLPDDTPSPFTIKLYFIATYVSGILYYVSTTVNPILYQIMSLKFREAFKDSLSRCCCQKGRRRSYSMLSRQQKTMGQAGKKGTGPESVTDSGASGSGTGSSYRHDLHKNRHISESSYVLNESCNKTIIPMEIVVGQDRSKVYVIKRNCPHEVEVDEEKKSDSLCWISCITSPTDKTKSIKVTWKIDEKNLSPGPNRRLSGSSNNISNSSLKDVDRHELQDELSQYIFSTTKRNL